VSGGQNLLAYASSRKRHETPEAIRLVAWLRKLFPRFAYDVIPTGGLAQTLLFTVCDLPKATLAEGYGEISWLPPWSLRDIADSKLRSLGQPPGPRQADSRLRGNDRRRGEAPPRPYGGFPLSPGGED